MPGHSVPLDLYWEIFTKGEITRAERRVSYVWLKIKKTSGQLIDLDYTGDCVSSLMQGFIQFSKFSLMLIDIRNSFSMKDIKEINLRNFISFIRTKFLLDSLREGFIIVDNEKVRNWINQELRYPSNLRGKGFDSPKIPVFCISPPQKDLSDLGFLQEVVEKWCADNLPPAKKKKTFRSNGKAGKLFTMARKVEDDEESTFQSFSYLKKSFRKLKSS